MPVLHQYEDESGYYFRAKPSGLNTPITYQVHNSARSFFCDPGYRDGDSVPWEVIQPLRAIGHIYTNGQGVEEGDPTDSISGKIAELSEKGREKLIDYIEQYTDLSIDKERELERLLEGEIEEVNEIIELLNGNTLSQSTGHTLPPSLRRIAPEHFGSSSQQTVVASSRGNGNGYTDGFELDAAPVLVSAKHDGAKPLKLRFMTSEMRDSDESPRNAFYDSSPFDGRFVWEEAQNDEYILNVTADGEWNLLISQGVPKAEEVPLLMVGRDFEVFGPFEEDGFLSLEYQYYGETWFEVNTVNENGERESELFETDYLSNDIKGKVVEGSIAFSSNVPYVTIESYGEWQVNLTRA